MSGAIETEKTADVELWRLFQWLCHDCPVVDGVPTAYGDAETYSEAQRAIFLLPMNKDDIIYQLAISVQDREYGPYAPDGPTALERWLQDRA